jgi:hypothetical protein
MVNEKTLKDWKETIIQELINNKETRQQVTLEIIEQLQKGEPEIALDMLKDYVKAWEIVKEKVSIEFTPEDAEGPFWKGKVVSMNEKAFAWAPDEIKAGDVVIVPEHHLYIKRLEKFTLEYFDSEVIAVVEPDGLND